jgi:MinD-like ATPase involved in chromosome partitioning or flagellar assembly
LDRGFPTTADAFGPRWLAEHSHVAPTTAVIVVDAGSGPSVVVQALWGASDAVLLVTAPDAASVVNGYALLKLLRAAADPTVYCLVNRVQDAAVAGTVFGRIHRASRRFLGLEPRPAGFVPEDRAFAVAEGGGTPLVLAVPAGTARERLLRAASAVSEGLQAVRAENYPLISCQERLNLEPRSDRYTRTLSVAEQPLNYSD